MDREETIRLAQKAIEKVAATNGEQWVVSHDSSIDATFTDPDDPEDRYTGVIAQDLQGNDREFILHAYANYAALSRALLEALEENKKLEERLGRCRRFLETLASIDSIPINVADGIIDFLEIEPGFTGMLAGLSRAINNKDWKLAFYHILVLQEAVVDLQDEEAGKP